MAKKVKKIQVKLNPIMPRKYNMARRKELLEFEKSILENYKECVEYNFNKNTNIKKYKI